LQDFKLTDREKTTTGNCNTWKMNDLIAPCYLNIIIRPIYSSDGTATTV